MALVSSTCLRRPTIAVSPRPAGVQADRLRFRLHKRQQALLYCYQLLPTLCCLFAPAIEACHPPFLRLLQMFDWHRSKQTLACAGSAAEAKGIFQTNFTSVFPSVKPSSQQTFQALLAWTTSCTCTIQSLPVSGCCSWRKQLVPSHLHQVQDLLWQQRQYDCFQSQYSAMYALLTHLYHVEFVP